MTWLNFMSNYKGPQGNFGKKSWDLASEAGFSPSQIKTALQHQGQSGYSLGSNLVAEMQQHKGAAHGLSQFQGAHGNLGQQAYNAAKDAGWAPQDIYNEIQSGRSGMFMPEGAMNQYLADIAAATPAPTPLPLPLPGTQTGQANVGAGYNSLGIKTKVGSDLATGGTKKAFGRDKKNRDMIAAQLAINPLT